MRTYIFFYADRLYLRDFHSCKTNLRGTDTPRKLRDKCDYIVNVLQVYKSFMYNVVENCGS